MKSSKEAEPYLCTGDGNFSDLCGGRFKSDGIKIPTGATGQTLHHTLLIAGFAGTGKSTLAGQFLAQSLKRNNQGAVDGSLKSEISLEGERGVFWPTKAQGIYYTLDQPGREITRMLTMFKWLNESDIVTINESEHTESLDELYHKATPETKAKFESCLVFVRELPYDILYQRIRELIKSDIRPRSVGKSVKIVVVDSLNSISREKEENALASFKRLIEVAKESPEENKYSMIITYELDERVRLAEEYLADAVIVLNREKEAVARRTIEIRKARRQEHVIGIHEFRIEDECGIAVFPSVAARARMIPKIRYSHSITEHPIAFGVKSIDDVLSSQQSWHINGGSTTLIWGDPGTGKTDLSIRFLVEQWRASPQTSVLFLTTKVDQRIIMNSLMDVAKKDEDLKQRLDTAPTFEEAISCRVSIVESGDPFRSHSRIFTDVVDSIHLKKQQNLSVKRAVVFGLGLLEETPQVRDDQWRFMSVLVLYLRSLDISTVLIDWPLERRRGDPERPRASKLCANEFRTYLDAEHRKLLTVSRSDYSSVERNFRWEDERSTWISLPK